MKKTTKKKKKKQIPKDRQTLPTLTQKSFTRGEKRKYKQAAMQEKKQ